MFKRPSIKRRKINKRCKCSKCGVNRGIMSETAWFCNICDDYQICRSCKNSECKKVRREST